MNVPAYLQPYAVDAQIDKHAVSFRVRCSCGCGTLQITSRTPTPAEQAAAEKWRGYTAEYDFEKEHWCMRKGHLFFKKKEPISEDEALLLHPSTVVRAACTACGKEILLFDEDEHGYDASDPRKPDPDYIDDEPLDEAVYAPLSEPGEVDVSLRYEISFKEFVMEAEKTYEEDFDEENAAAYYDLAFSAIEIAVENDGSMKTVFSRNTAETWDVLSSAFTNPILRMISKKFLTSERLENRKEICAP